MHGRFWLEMAICQQVPSLRNLSVPDGLHLGEVGRVERTYGLLVSVPRRSACTLRSAGSSALKKPRGRTAVAVSHEFWFRLAAPRPRWARACASDVPDDHRRGSCPFQGTVLD
jgi:hypothetical protein